MGYVGLWRCYLRYLFGLVETTVGLSVWIFLVVWAEAFCMLGWALFWFLVVVWAL